MFRFALNIDFGFIKLFTKKRVRPALVTEGREETCIENASALSEEFTNIEVVLVLR